jgi:hypothetical protein
MSQIGSSCAPSAPAWSSHNWVLPDRWTKRHRPEVASTEFDDPELVHTVAQELDFWLVRHEGLLDDLACLGLRVQTTTYASHQERYRVVARRDD